MKLEDYKIGDRVTFKGVYSGEKGLVTRVDETGVTVLLDEPITVSLLDNGVVLSYFETEAIVSRIKILHPYYIEKMGE